jgi:hypothetical protein
MLATVVDTESLWRTVVASFVAGVGTTFVFSIAILGAARVAEAQRHGRSGEAVVFTVVAAVGFLATLAAIVIGVVVMTTK